MINLRALKLLNVISMGKSLNNGYLGSLWYKQITYLSRSAMRRHARYDRLVTREPKQNPIITVNQIKTTKGVYECSVISSFMLLCASVLYNGNVL